LLVHAGDHAFNISYNIVPSFDQTTNEKNNIPRRSFLSFLPVPRVAGVKNLPGETFFGGRGAIL